MKNIRDNSYYYFKVLECLSSNKPKLGEACRSQVFRVRKQEFQDSSSDFALFNECHTMVRQFCRDVDRSKALDCLKLYKDNYMFDDKCREFVMKRMAEQNTDYRFNNALQAVCSKDINRHCNKASIFFSFINGFQLDDNWILSKKFFFFSIPHSFSNLNLQIKNMKVQL